MEKPRTELTMRGRARWRSASKLVVLLRQDRHNGLQYPLQCLRLRVRARCTRLACGANGANDAGLADALAASVENRLKTSNRQVADDGVVLVAIAQLLLLEPQLLHDLVLDLMAIVR